MKEELENSTARYIAPRQRYPDNPILLLHLTSMPLLLWLLRFTQQHRSCWHFVPEHLSILAQPSCQTIAQLSSLWLHRRLQKFYCRYTVDMATLTLRRIFKLSNALQFLFRDLQYSLHCAVQNIMDIGVSTPELSVLQLSGPPTNFDINGSYRCLSQLFSVFSETVWYYTGQCLDVAHIFHYSLCYTLV